MIDVPSIQSSRAVLEGRAGFRKKRLEVQMGEWSSQKGLLRRVDLERCWDFIFRQEALDLGIGRHEKGRCVAKLDRCEAGEASR